MPVATTSAILTKVYRSLKRDAKAAAGDNQLISRTEQQRLDGVLTKAAEHLRQTGGAGTKVNVDAVVSEASTRMKSLLGEVNQRSGPGAARVSADEVRALLTRDPAAGKRVSRAYELITGRKISVPTVVDGPAIPQLNAARFAQITEAARSVARSGDMMNGELPVGPRYLTLDVLQDETARTGRRYSISIPLGALSPGATLADPNKVELVWLVSVDDEGIQRTATFDVPVAVTGSDRNGREIAANLQAPVDGLQRWHDSGDNGVDTRVIHLEGATSAADALEKLLTQASSGQGGTLLPGEGESALNAFRAGATESLEEWRATFYDDNTPPNADENTDAMMAFDAAVASTFGSLSDVRGARGNDGETYLMGQVDDGYVAVVIWPYRDG